MTDVPDLPAVPSGVRTATCAVSAARPEGFPFVTPEALGPLVAAGTTYNRSVYTAPGGVERHEVITLRVGDYFDEVRVTPVGTMGGPSERRTVALEFRVRPEASSLWKAVVVEVLKAARALAPGVRAELVRSEVTP